MRLAIRALAGVIGAASAVLLAAAPLAAQSAAADSAALALVERSTAAYGSARTLHATFSQTLTNPRTANVMRARGEFLQRGAEQFAFRFTDPAGDAIVADGDVLWLYLPSAAKGQVLKVPRAAGAGLDLVESVLRSPRERYRVAALGDTTIDGRDVKAVALTPRTSDAPFVRATLWIDAQALIRRALLVEHSGLERLLEFTSVRTGVTLPSDAFVFTPPPGVRIIDQAALMGGSVPPKKKP
ncbi:MAG TPA: outer membrane lipoprotein carrier protein LolA [Gemmatimonadaceae bacterium]|nr:outer membrane lipoprotein carrier protein LolA [Gemmatimonadaceae bacterium]